MRDKLLKVVRKLKTDYHPFGKTEPEESDCASGCRHFLGLTGDAGREWGVCANPASPRGGLLTFVHQGCTAFEPILIDQNLTDAQLRSIIGEASQILKNRRCERVETSAPEETKVPGESGEHLYDVKTSYFPRIIGHRPSIFRLEPHESGFVAIPLAARIRGSQRPSVTGRYPARNGEVFKIVRENGEYSYQVPLDGKLYNLKQHGHLSDVGIQSLEVLRRFLESVEPDIFDSITGDAKATLSNDKESLDKTQDQLRRWHKREFWATETPANKREAREMLREAEDLAERIPISITEEEAFIEWLKGILGGTGFWGIALRRIGEFHSHTEQ